MASQLVSSSEFASLVNQLQKAPHDALLKLQVVKVLPQMRELAKNNPLALYHLAHVYPPKSPQYKQMMMQAADLGCTNAMLATAQLLAESGSDDDLELAINYLHKIAQSDDSYVQENAQQIIEQHPRLTGLIQYETKACQENSYRFFAQKLSAKTEIPLEEQSICQL